MTRTEPSSKQDIESQVVAIVSEHAGVDPTEITRETTFVVDLGFDSLDMVEIQMEFEDAFEIIIPEEPQDQIKSVGQAMDYIKQHVQAS